MKRVLMGCVFIFSVSSANAIECRADLPSHHTSHWTYRMLDGRKCWYEGKRMVSKALLHWSASNVSTKAPSEPVTSGQNALAFGSESSQFGARQSFESRWQAIFGASASRP
jgi:hypothetical protein